MKVDVITLFVFIFGMLIVLPILTFAIFEKEEKDERNSSNKQK